MIEEVSKRQTCMCDKRPAPSEVPTIDRIPERPIDDQESGKHSEILMHMSFREIATERL
ncbi:hypothetical protein OVY29_03315 [Sphingopyxis sp. SE2]|nr:hypothetical protein [Sphingopyxis sp. SE2]